MQKSTHPRTKALTIKNANNFFDSLKKKKTRK